MTKRKGHGVGGNRGAWHKKARRRAPKGSATTNANGHRLSPRQSASYDAIDLKCIRYLARRDKVTVSEMLRRAVGSYVAPIRGDIAAGREPVFTAKKGW